MSESDLAMKQMLEKSEKKIEVTVIDMFEVLLPNQSGGLATSHHK